MENRLSLKQAAQEIGVSTATVYRQFFRDPDFKVYKIGGRTYIDRPDLEQWIQIQKEKELVAA